MGEKKEMTDWSKFKNSMIHMSIDTDSEEGKHWASWVAPSMYYGDIKKGKQFTISYSYNTEEKTINGNTKMYSVIIKTFSVKVTKVKKNIPQLDIWLEKVK